MNRQDLRKEWQDELPSKPFAENDEYIPSDIPMNGSAKLHDEVEAVRAGYSSKECLKQIVCKSGLPKRVDGSIDIFVCISKDKIQQTD